MAYLKIEVDQDIYNTTCEDFGYSPEEWNALYQSDKEQVIWEFIQENMINYRWVEERMTDDLPYDCCED